MKATHNPPITADVEPTPADILRCAANYLRRHGWTQGTYFADQPGPDGFSVHPNPTPPACALGALAMAAFGQRFPEDAYDRPEWVDYKRAEDALMTYLGLLYPPAVDDDYPEPEVGDWNDQPDRTVEQVITALHEAATEWETSHTRQAVIA